MKTPSIVYARFSPRPDAAESESIQYQFEACREYAEAHGYEVEAYFSDEGVSGAVEWEKRPGLRNALASIPSGGVLIVHNWDRLARATIVHCAIEAYITGAGGNIVSVMQNDSTAEMDPDKVLIRNIMKALSEHQRSMGSIRTSVAMKSYQRNGKRMTHPKLVPYGYKCDPKDMSRIIPDRNEQDIIQHIKDMHGAGLEPRKIVNCLTKARVMRRSGDYWSSRAVEKILRDHAG